MIKKIIYDKKFEVQWPHKSSFAFDFYKTEEEADKQVERMSMLLFGKKVEPQITDAREMVELPELIGLVIAQYEEIGVQIQAKWNSELRKWTVTAYGNGEDMYWSSEQSTKEFFEGLKEFFESCGGERVAGYYS